MISYKGDKILAIFLLIKRTIRLFSLRMRGNGYVEASGRNLTLLFAPATSITVWTVVHTVLTAISQSN